MEPAQLTMPVMGVLSWSRVSAGESSSALSGASLSGVREINSRLAFWAFRRRARAVPMAPEAPMMAMVEL